MNFAEAWTEIRGTISTSRRVKIPDYSEEALGFTGGGRTEVVRIERELGKKLPVDFAYYVEKLAPRENSMSEQISMPFMAFLKLYSFANLSVHTYSEQREQEKQYLREPFLVGDDSSNFIVVDLEHPSCPTHLSDEFGCELLAHSFADFMRILFYRDMILNTVDSGTDYENYDESVEGPRWAEAEAQIEEKITKIAPDCLKAWH